MVGVVKRGCGRGEAEVVSQSQWEKISGEGRENTRPLDKGGVEERRGGMGCGGGGGS
jgi:hypothetical protein